MVRSQDLLMREPALAMLMGALPQGENFGFGGGISAYDPSLNIGFGWGRGGGYGYAHPNHTHHPYEPWGGYPPPPMDPYDQYDTTTGYGYGVDPATAPPPPMMVHPAMPMPPVAAVHPQHAHHIARRWELANPASTLSRTLLLDPNRDSKVKVERYSFSFSPTTNLVLGTASNIGTFTQQPSTSIKGQRVIMNAPVPGFVLVSSLQVANVNVLVGGTEDAFTYSAGAQGVMLDLPRLDPQNRATASGAYTGVLPSGYTQGNSFQFIITLQGPSTLAGGYGQ